MSVGPRPGVDDGAGATPECRAVPSDSRIYLVVKLHEGGWLAVKFTDGEAAFRSTKAEADTWVQAMVKGKP